MTERDILYQRGRFWVATARMFSGFEVWQDGVTCASRVASIGYAGAEGLRRAIAETDRRAVKIKA